MWKNSAFVFLINLIILSSVNSYSENYHYRSPRWHPSYTNREPFGHRRYYNVAKRDLETYPDYQNDGQTRGRGYYDKRSDNGSFKILNQGYASRGKREQSDIVFPGPKSESSSSAVVKLDSSPCINTSRTFCEKVDTYPKDHIDQILKNSVVDILEFLPKDDDSIEIGERFNAPGQEELCQSYTDVFRPKSAENKYGQWLYVINQDNYVQEIKMEICSGSEEGCKFSENFPLGYKTLCKQKYIYRTLYALDGNLQKVIQDSFKLPSCCSCVVEHTGEIISTSRFGHSGAASSHSRKTSKKRRSINRH